MTVIEQHADPSLLAEPTARDYWELLKPRVMSLVIFTALVGLVVAPGGIHPVIGFTALLCIAVGAGAAGALNMWYEADIDARMARTQSRPIPDGRIEPASVLAFGLTLAVASVLSMGLLVNVAAAAFLAFTIFFYAVIYTMWLKRVTPQNIVIGGAAGAFPPMIAWTAVTGTLSLESAALFAIIFLWTPPHFWALALYREGDYARAGVPMMPVVAGPSQTRRQIVLYTAALVAASLSPFFLGFGGGLYLGAALVLGAIFLAFSVDLWRAEAKERSERAAKGLFAYSILYLFLLFAVLLVEQGFGIGWPA